MQQTGAQGDQVIGTKTAKSDGLIGDQDHQRVFEQVVIECTQKLGYEQRTEVAAK